MIGPGSDKIMIGHVMFNQLNMVNIMVDMVNMVDMMRPEWSTNVVNVVNMFIVLIKMVNMVNILNICRSSTFRTSTCSIPNNKPVWSRCCRLFRQCHQQRRPRKESDICCLHHILGFCEGVFDEIGFQSYGNCDVYKI